MKLLVVCLFVTLMTVVLAGTEKHSRGCIYINGRCKEECPEGTHAYTTVCSRRLPEATCFEPKPVLEDRILCGYSSCYCDPPTVRDLFSNKCVNLEDCPK